VISLVIDASTYVGTAAVFDDTRVLAEGDAAMRGATEERLMPLVADVMRNAGVSIGREVDRIVCGGGPGSFTSLRIAASIAKGLSLGAGRPLVAVPSLALMLASSAAAPGRYVCTLNALRGEWYAAAYDRDAAGAVTSHGTVAVLDPAGVAAYAATVGATVIGELAGDDRRPHARGAFACAATFDGPLDVATWSPIYGRLAEAQVKWEAQHGRPLGPT
jgi:tRNA threonylcarbamoyladenosine biosynthesis protein TsaB